MAEAGVGARSRSPLAGSYGPGRFGNPDGPAGVRLAECAGRLVFSVHGVARARAPLPIVDPHDARAVGVPVAVLPGRPVLRLLRLGPYQWLAVSAQACELRPERLRRLFAGSPRLFDLSAAYVAIEVEGPGARAALAHGCPLDLSGLPVGSAAASLLGAFPVVLERREAGFELLLRRSTARSAWRWLVEASLESGCEIAPPPESGRAEPAL